LATIQHSSLTDSDGLHEPKGVATATSGDVYVADGAGSGSWDPLEGTEIASTGEAGAIKYLREDGDGTSSWQPAVAEGTAILSTGEVGGTKFLREDGDNTCSWQVPTIEGSAVLSTGEAGGNKYLREDGDNSSSWQQIPASDLDATGENKGRIITSDGSNGAGWQQLVWKDLVGSITVRGTGPTSPALSAYQGGNIDQFAFSAGDEVMVEFHIPHDYAPGTDLYLHFHWSHNGTAISGDMTWAADVTYAKGFNQANFPAAVSTSVTFATTDITTTPQYRHRVDEVQLSASSPSGSQIDTDDIEVDGVILMRVSASAIPTITGGSPNEPFLHFVDIHYQAGYIGTANKAPNFYA